MLLRLSLNCEAINYRLVVRSDKSIAPAELSIVTITKEQNCSLAVRRRRHDSVAQTELSIVTAAKQQNVVK